MQKIVTTNLCDRHLKRGEDVDATALQVQLVVGKHQRKLDLCATCSEELDAALQDFLDAGVKVTVLDPQARPARRSRRRLASVAEGPATAGAAAPGVTRTTEVRAWAKENGYKVSDRGRIPADVTEAFNKSREAVIDLREPAALSQ